MADYRNEFETPRTPEHPTGTQPRKSVSTGVGLAIFFIVLIVLIAIGFFASQATFDRQTAESRLNEWTRYTAQVAQANGYTLAFAKSDIVIEGQLFSKRAHVIAPSFTLNPIGNASPELTRTVTAESAYIIPGLLGTGDTAIQVDSPILINDGNGRLRVSASEALEWQIDDYHGKDGNGLAYALPLPSQLVLDRLGRQSDAVVSSSSFSFGAKSEVNGKIDTASNAYTQEITAKAVGLKHNGRELTAAGLTCLTEMTNENGQSSTHYTTHVDQLQTNGMLHSLGPVDGDLDIDFREPPVSTADSVGAPGGRHVLIQKLLLTLPSAKILLTGDVREVANEIVPFGAASVEVDHPSQLIDALEKTEALHGIDRALFVTMLGKVAPDWKGGDAPVKIDLKREQNAPFYLGALTFENFTAQLLNQLLQQSGHDLSLLPGTAPLGAMEQGISPVTPGGLAPVAPPATNGAAAVAGPSAASSPNMPNATVSPLEPLPVSPPHESVKEGTPAAGTATPPAATAKP